MRFPVLLATLLLVGCQQGDGGFPNVDHTESGQDNGNQATLTSEPGRLVDSSISDSKPNGTTGKAAQAPTRDRSGTTLAVSTGSKTNLLAGRLATELFRQTVLLVAAEDLGLPTQDESLAKFPSHQAMTVERIDVNACSEPPDLEDRKTHRAVEIRLRTNPNEVESSESILLALMPEEKSPRRIGRYYESYGPEKYVDLGDTVQVYHDLAPEIIAALKTSGFQEIDSEDPTALSEENKAEIADIELRLREMSFVSQFEAIRAGHELPSTPQKHRLLAYGYANLGMLTQHHWSANHKVFFARSLVHAERAFRDDPGDASLAARAYARALTGLHGSALELLNSRKSDPTPRLQVVDAFCRFRTDELLALAEKHPEIRELATLLASIAIEASEDQDRALEVYQAAVDANPNCFRVYDAIASFEQISLMHDLTARGLDQLVTAVPTRLRAMTDLPDPVRTAINVEPVLPGDLADAMQSVEDGNATHGINWSLLGTLIRDEALVQVQRRIWFVQGPLGLSTAGIREQSAAFVGDHELAILALEPYSDTPDWKQIQESAELYVGERRGVASFEPTFSDMGPQFTPLLRDVLFEDIPQEITARLYTAMRSSTDWIARDIVLVRIMNTKWISESRPDAGVPLDALATLSPHHPQRFLREIRREDAVPERLQKLESQIADRPALLTHLATAMMEQGMLADALRVATHVTEVSPSYESFRTLARLHSRNGDKAKYIQHLKDAVQFPSPSLAPAWSRMEIAYYLMAQDQYEQAESYATKAAESYAEWAMECAIDCYTGLEKYDLAEQWHIRRLQRYGHNPDLWYTWCVATGQGDIETARSLVEARIAPYREKTMEQMTVHEALSIAWWQVLEGDDVAGADLRAHIARREKNPAAGLHAVLLYLRGGERGKAMELLHQCVGWTTRNEKAPGAARRAGIFLKSLESGQPLERSAIEQLDRDIETFAENERLLFHAIYGELFFHTGNPEAGMDFLKQAVAFPPATGDKRGYANYDRAYATVWLRERLATPSSGVTSASPVTAPKPQSP